MARFIWEGMAQVADEDGRESFAACRSDIISRFLSFHRYLGTGFITNVLFVSDVTHVQVRFMRHAAYAEITNTSRTTFHRSLI